MKILRSILVAFALSAAAFAWTCPTGQHWVQVAVGTPGATVVEGITFQCQPNTPAPTGTNNTLSNVNTNTNTANSTSNSTSNSASNSTSSASSNQTQQQKQSQSQVATGGNATSSAANNGNNSNNTTVEAPKIPVASAIAPPVLPTVPCFKGAGGAVQAGMIGGSFGGGKVDQGCDDRELARAFSGQQTVASCKILLNTKKAKKAHITMEDCLGKTPEVSPIVAQLVTPEPAPVILPPAVTIINQMPSPPEYRTEITVTAPTAPKITPKAKKTKPAPCKSEVKSCKG